MYRNENISARTKNRQAKEESFNRIKYTFLHWKWIHAEKANGYIGKDFLSDKRTQG